MKAVGKVLEWAITVGTILLLLAMLAGIGFYPEIFAERSRVRLEVLLQRHHADADLILSDYFVWELTPLDNLTVREKWHEFWGDGKPFPQQVARPIDLPGAKVVFIVGMVLTFFSPLVLWEEQEKKALLVKLKCLTRR